jgi:PAS domain S-box-containing protein
MNQPEREQIFCGSRNLHDPQRVLALATQAYVAITTAGHVVAWNPAATATFGYSFDEACGEDLAELIIPLRFRAAHRAALARLAARSPETVDRGPLRLCAAHRDGHEFPIELALACTIEPAGPLFHAFATDMTTADRVQRFTAVEAAVARGLIEADSSQVAGQRVVTALGDGMGWPVVELWLADDDRQLVACAARHAPGERELGPFAVDQLELGTGLPGRVYQQSRPVWIPDLAADTASFRSLAGARIGLHVAVGVPIRTGRHTLGALCVYGDRVEDPEGTLTALLAGIAAQVGQYLERRRAEELAVELARTKDEFLAMVTHEIRNPLGVITTVASVLADDLEVFTPGEQRRHLDTIVRSAQRLNVMAEDLLDLARLESGHLALQRTRTDLCAMLREAVHAAEGSAQEKKLFLSADLPERLELDADPGRLRQVADNLLSNAIKYTPAGGCITVTAATFGDSDEIIWTVADTGIGIPEMERPKLFRRFYRASTAVAKAIPGTGLGLVIVRAIVERHHGSITLADTGAVGTTFVIRLPRMDPG